MESSTQVNLLHFTFIYKVLAPLTSHFSTSFNPKPCFPAFITTSRYSAYGDVSALGCHCSLLFCDGSTFVSLTEYFSLHVCLGAAVWEDFLNVTVAKFYILIRLLSKPALTLQKISPFPWKSVILPKIQEKLNKAEPAPMICISLG